MKDKILNIITSRINELKYEKVHLKLFIETDKAKSNQIDKTILELEQLYKKILDTA